jgi:hypothetical protein
MFSFCSSLEYDRSTCELAHAETQADGEIRGGRRTRCQGAPPLSGWRDAGRIWESVLNDPQVATRPGVPIQQRRLSEIPRHVLRVACRRCGRIVEIQKADAVRFYGQHAVWKDVGQKLLDNTCENRTDRYEEDGCWPSFETS